MRRVVYFFLIFVTLGIGAASFAVYGIPWDDKIARHLQTIESQTGLILRATPQSRLTLKGLQVDGVVITGVRDAQAILRDVTFGFNVINWIQGKSPFDRLRVEKVEITRNNAIIYQQKNIIFSIKKTDDNRIIVAGHGMALRLLIQPQKTDFDWVFSNQWLISGSWFSGGRIVFRAPPPNMQGFEGALTLKPNIFSGNVRLHMQNTEGTMKWLTGLSLETLIPETVDFTLRGISFLGGKDAVIRFHRVATPNPVMIDVTADHPLGPLTAKITAMFDQEWRFVFDTLRLGNVQGGGSWNIKTTANKNLHDIRLRLRYVSLSSQESTDILSVLRQLEDTYQISLIAEDIKIGPLTLYSLDYQASIKDKTLDIDHLTLKTSAQGRFSLAGSLSYPTRTPYFDMQAETMGPFFSDLMASFPNFPKIFSHLNGNTQTNIKGYANYPAITLKHRAENGALSSFQGNLEPLTAPPRFNGTWSHEQSAETRVTMTVVRGENDLRLSNIQGLIGSFPFSGQAAVDLMTTPPTMTADFYAPQLSVQALSALGASQLFHASDVSSCREAKDLLPLPFATRDAQDLSANILVRIDRLMMAGYNPMTQVEQKISLSPAGVKLAMMGHYGLGFLRMNANITPNQGLPALEMKLQGNNLAMPSWGGGTASFFMSTTSFGACLNDHMQTFVGEGSLSGKNMRPSPAILKQAQDIAGPALGKTLTDQDIEIRSMILNGAFKQGVLTLQQGDFTMPIANIGLTGSIHMASKNMNLQAAVTSNTLKEPLTINLQGPPSNPRIQINNQSPFQYLLKGLNK